MKKRKLESYMKAYGETSIEDPNMRNAGRALTKINIDQVDAMREVVQNPWLNALEGVGRVGIGIGSSMLGAVAGPMGQQIGDLVSQGLIQYGKKGSTYFALGGEVPVEVEGEEVAETPQGHLMQFKGASHEQGGIDVDLPSGTDIYSNRISIDGKTMAERKKEREKILAKMEKALAKKKGDNLLKNSYKRTLELNNLEEEQDKQIQEYVRAIKEGQPLQGNKEAAYGGKLIAEYGLEGLEGFEGLDGGGAGGFGGGGWESIIGNSLGLTGELIQAFGPINNTLNNRAGDTPNVNMFKDFGKDALKTNDENLALIEQETALNKADLQLARNSEIRRLRNSARSVNTMRALDLTTDQSANKELSNIYKNKINATVANNNTKSQLQNIKDQVVMQGEQNRDLADRQDRDNFYTQYASDLNQLGMHMTGIGKNFNTASNNSQAEDLINVLSENGINIEDLISEMKSKRKVKKKK